MNVSALPDVTSYP